MPVPTSPAPGPPTIADTLPITVPLGAEDPTGFFVGPLDDPDRYELVGERAKGPDAPAEGIRGGEGVVWRARYRGDLPKPLEDIAVKILIPPPGRSPTDWPDSQQEQRWRQDIELLAHCDSPHLVRHSKHFSAWPPHHRNAVPAGQLPPNDLRTHYVVMEWVSGRTMHDLVHGSQSSFSERFYYLIGLARAVDHLHSGERTGGNQLLHRDIKPNNVIIHRSRGAVLVDFGLLKVVGPEPTVQKAWAEGYTAPEVRADRTSYSVKSDLWSVGAVGFFLATGGLPGRSRRQNSAASSNNRFEHKASLGLASSWT